MIVLTGSAFFALVFLGTGLSGLRRAGGLEADLA
jgi:hypothetical protein